ncbi:helix-hairpin-helix domain-containing protein [Nevskia soli]|uniref:helix-hairpin-helix domain-containing protein n=1 Tax=Nevskia soli TaxID=418856 RepID=UPI0015D733E0|nr:helix-hairpin-helix domain-containing protein [Nevskia soli]
MRQLRDLQGIGPAMLKDFELLNVRSVQQLAEEDGLELYERLNHLSGTRQDPCVLDTFRCAVAQAKNPRLSDEKRNWWYWSRRRKANVL